MAGGRPPRAQTCFRRGCNTAPGHGTYYKYSAFCEEHQPEVSTSRIVITGKKQCQCSGCGELFTTSRTFDSHQTFQAGMIICKDPRRMFRKADHRRLLVLTTRGWAKNPELDEFNTFTHTER
jgi:hypothetical protein